MSSTDTFVARNKAWNTFKAVEVVYGLPLRLFIHYLLDDL